VAFRFTLEQVLRVRESVERREELMLQRAEAEVAVALRRIEELTEQVVQIGRRREESMKQPLAAFELQSMDAEINATIEERKAMLVTLQTLQNRRDEQRKVYQAAHNGRRMLTDLEEQQRDEYEQEQVRVQQRRLDDLFAARIQRQ
jgi:flagellar export protein FliJ